MRWVLAAAVLAAACSTSNDPPPVVCEGTAPFAPGSNMPTAKGLFTVRIVRAEPPQPTRGVNTWTIEVLDPAGSPMTVDLLRLRAWNPSLGRGSQPLWSTAMQFAGAPSYRAGPFELGSTGLWEFTVEATKDGSIDEAKVAFCVQGVDLDAGVVAEDAAVRPSECMTVAPSACVDPAPKFVDVQPIFMERCVVCHDGRGDEWPLTSYAHVADWYAEIRAEMLKCSMPPPDAGVSMELEERQRILEWLRCGLPR